MNHNIKPLISIITVVYNENKKIEDTILSILNQDFDCFEYVIIDGGSTDGTVDVIKKYQDRISNWVSEPDKGIYDAMNKGIQRAKGKYVCFINSGDLLVELPVNILSTMNADLCAFSVLLSNGIVFVPKVDFSLRIRNTLPHQGCFYKNSKTLQFNTHFKVFSDFNLNQQLYKAVKSIAVFSEPIVASHDIGGISHDKKYAKEIFCVVQENFGFHYRVLSWFYFKIQGFKLRFKNLIS